MTYFTDMLLVPAGKEPPEDMRDIMGTSLMSRRAEQESEEPDIRIDANRFLADERYKENVIDRVVDMMEKKMYYDPTGEYPEADGGVRMYAYNLERGIDRYTSERGGSGMFIDVVEEDILPVVERRAGQRWAALKTNHYDYDFDYDYEVVDLLWYVPDNLVPDGPDD